MTYETLPRRILGPDPGLYRPSAHGLIRVVGPEAVGFLQRLSSQDVAGLAPGHLAPAAFLDPKGKLLATCLAGVFADEVALSVQQGRVGELAELLDRFHFTEKLEVQPADELVCAEVLSVDPLPEPAGAVARIDGGGVRLSTVRHGLHRVRHHAPAELLDFPADLPVLDHRVVEALRIATAVPLVGVDTESNTLAMEAPLGDHISTTKGCYTGQEIVARILTYGHTNRALRVLEIDGRGGIEPGTALVDNESGGPVGRVMSSAPIAEENCRVAFGFVPRELSAVGTELALGAVEGEHVRVVGPVGDGS